MATSCWASVLAAIGGHAADDPDTPHKGEEKTPATLQLHRRLLAGRAAAASEKEEAKNLAEANRSREAAEAERREAEARAEAAEAELRAAKGRHDAQVEELRRALDAQEDRDARMQELEDRIRDLNNANSKWRFF